MPTDRAERRPRDLLVAGHVNLDRFLAVDRFPGADRTVPVTGQRTELGGTASLLALSAAARGVRVGLVARVGSDFPEPFRQRLRSAHIDLRGLETVTGTSSPTCFIVEQRDGGQRTLIDQGPMGDARRARLPGRWLSDYGWLHLSTGDPSFQLRLAAIAQRAGLKVALDPAQEIFYRWTAPRFRSALARAELLFGNEAEIDRAARLAGVRRAGLLDQVPLIVRTEGRGGATAVSRSGTLHVPAARPRTVRTLVGAGDAFRGGFYAQWFAGAPLRACLVGGVRAARARIEGRS